MIMKQKILTVSVAAALAGGMGIAGPANAFLTVVETGVGHMLMLPYFTTQGGNNTLLNIVNTDTVNGKAVKIRFRSGVDSDDIFDFQVFLSPGDAWTAAISAPSATAASVLTTSDNSCTLPARSSLTGQSFITSRLASYTDPAGIVHDVNEQTREGYVEIFNTADIPPTMLAGTANPLFTSIKHVSGTPPCTATTLLGIEAAAIAGSWTPTYPVAATVPTSSAAPSAGQQLRIPTGTLMGNWTIINVPNSLTFSGAMPAIVSTLDQTMIVYSGQTAATVAATPSSLAVSGSSFPNVNQTADGVLVNGGPGATQSGVTTAKYDFPDMSTPYETSFVDPTTQAANLSLSYLRAGAVNEFFTDAALQGATDWTVSLSTRRYHVSGRGPAYNTTGRGWTVGAVIHGVAGGVTAPYVPANVTYATNGRSSCVATGSSPVWWSREEDTSGPSGAVISPGTPTLYDLCGEVNVLAWNNTTATSGALKATLIMRNSAASTTAGWARVAFGGIGLPALGNAYIKAFNANATAGVSGNYGATYPHRYQ